MSKKWAMGTAAVYTLASLAVSVYLFAEKGVGSGLVGLCSLLYLLIFPLCRRLFRVRPGWLLDTVLMVFIFCAFTLGTALAWYSRFAYYDLLMHFLSGVLVAMLGLCAYYWLREPDRRLTPPNRGMATALSFLFPQFVAIAWEMVEYIGFLLTGHDSQRVAETGVADTMEDMMICMAGALVMAILVWIHLGGKRRIPLLRPVDDWVRDSWHAEATVPSEDPADVLPAPPTGTPADPVSSPPEDAR